MSKSTINQIGLRQCLAFNCGRGQEGMCVASIRSPLINTWRKKKRDKPLQVTNGLWRVLGSSGACFEEGIDNVVESDAKIASEGCCEHTVHDH